MDKKDNANLIFPRLWLGNRYAAADDEWLRRNNIGTVFNCTKELPFSSVVHRQYRLPIDDNLEKVEIDNLYHWSSEVVLKVLREYNSGANILIHCHAGMQRSAAVMAMTIMAKTGKPFDEVMAYIRSKRPIAFFPAVNFDRAIRRFEADLRAIQGQPQV